MGDVRTLQVSFSGGELSPDFFGRIDDTQYRSGAAKLRNMAALPHGPARQRPGFRLVREVKDSSKKVRLLPFRFSSDQTLVIEMGPGYFRFHTDGATVLSGGVPYELPHSYLESELFDVNYVQSSDVMTLVHPKHRPAELRRMGATDWALTDINFASPLAAPSGVAVAGYMPPSASDGINEDTYQLWTYVVTALNAAGSESGPSAEALVRTNLYLTGAVNTISWRSVSGATRYRVYKYQGGVFGYMGETSDLQLTDDNIEPDVSQTPPFYDYSLMPNGIKSVAVTNGGSGYSDLTVAGGGILSVTVTARGAFYSSPPDVSVSDPTGSGAVLLAELTPNIVLFGRLVGGVRVIDSGQNYTSPSISFTGGGGGNGAAATANINPLETNEPVLDVVDPTGVGARIEAVVDGGAITAINVIESGYGYSSPTINVVDAGGGSGVVFGAIELTGEDYPGAVSYFEQRRVFAGTPKSPQTIWMTRSGTESAMSYSVPLRDDDRVSLRLAARENETIRHVVPLLDMALLTSGGEWRLTSINSDAITPTTVAAKQQAGIGASTVRPTVVNSSILYPAARGGHVREMGFSFRDGGYVTGDLSLRATHLFDGLQIVDSTYAKSPYPIVWFVSSSGKLLGFTYVPDQQVGAWHQHDTVGGLFESCCAVAEGNEDHLYAVVNRGGARYVERMADWDFTARSDAFVVDSGLSYNGPPVTTVSGLDHLEGQKVAILADGAVQARQTVVGGSITLDQPASVLHAGLPMTADLQTLPFAAQVDGAFGQGRAANINKVYLRVHRSGSAFVGPTEAELVEYKARTDEVPGAPPELQSRLIELDISPAWDFDGQVVVRNDDPLPLTVVALTLDIALGNF